MWFLTLLLSNCFYLFTNTKKTLWPNRQGKRLLTSGTFKNTGSKPVRDRFHGCGTLTSKERRNSHPRSSHPTSSLPAQSQQNDY